MKVWHDDVREAPFNWQWARTNEQAKEWLRTGLVEEISLDHDMGLGHVPIADVNDWDIVIAEENVEAPDGRELVDWMIKHDLVPPKVSIHSWNPEMAQEMALRLNDAGHNVTLKRFEAT